MTKERLDSLVSALKLNKGLNVDDYTLFGGDVGDINTFGNILDSTIRDFYTEFTGFKLYWYLDYDNTDIKILDEGNMVSGESNMSLETFYATLNRKPISNLEMSIAKTLDNLTLKENFIVLDNCSPDQVIGFLNKDGVVKDNLYMVCALDNNLYDLKVTAKTYFELGLSAGFFFHWQEIFINNSKYESDLEIIGYYLPKLLPESINSLYMSKFKERFGDIEYEVND